MQSQTLTPALNTLRLLQALEWLEQWDLRKAFATIECPVMAICGAKDLIVRADHSRACFSQGPLVMQQDAGHLMPVTHAPWLAEKIMTAIDGGSWSS